MSKKAFDRLMRQSVKMRAVVIYMDEVSKEHGSIPNPPELMHQFALDLKRLSDAVAEKDRQSN